MMDLELSRLYINQENNCLREFNSLLTIGLTISPKPDQNNSLQMSRWLSQKCAYDK